MPILLQRLSMISPRDIFNADEFGLFFQLPPTKTIGPGCLGERKKKKKDRATFLACVNADGSERLPPLVIGRSQHPRSFSGREVAGAGILYRSSPKAWMTRKLFFEWLLRVDTYIGQTPGRRVVLLVDNASCHGRSETLPTLANVDVIYLPKNTTSRTQPLDAGVIASVKSRYRKRQLERAVDLIEEGITDNLYSIDLYSAIRMIYEIWNRMETSIFVNCWAKTCLVPIAAQECTPTNIVEEFPIFDS